MKFKNLLFLMMMLFTTSLLKAQTVVDIIVNSPDHETLEAAVVAAGLVDALNGEGPFTVFAPTDDAFAALPEGTVETLLQDPQGLLTDILLNHVASGTVLSSNLSDGQIIITLNNGKTVKVTINDDGVFIGDAQVTVADIVAENGVVHVIDAVILPPTTVADIIIGSSEHNTLEVAVKAAGLLNTLNGAGPFTVFAPTDEAFDALPAGTLESLLQNPRGLLSQILLYHVNYEKFLSTDLNNGQIIFTALPFNETVVVTINNDGVFINDAKVTVVDIETDNGVVHVIDAVLIPSNQSAMDFIANSTEHAILTSSIIAAELATTLDGEGPFTVFAPTDAAFTALTEGTIEALFNDIPTLTSILTYHVVGADARSTDLSDGQVITTLNGSDITVTINADGVFINDAQVTIADIVVENGVVHVIDAVLLPPAASNTVVDIIVNSTDHNTLEAAVIAAGLVDALNGEGPFTVFAPTDAAFDALPDGTLDGLLNDIPLLTAILTYHVVGADARSTDLTDGQVITTLNGSDVTVTINADGVFINNAQVTVVDLVADNGVVHVIDAVLLPPVASNTVVDVIVNSPDHNTLEAAVIAAGLVDALSGEGPFTVFAPTDAAFDALTEGTLDALLNDIPALTAILTYHVVGADARSTDLTDGQVITTLNGSDVTVTINADGVFINNAQVTVADIVADNGVVHVIDAVLLPPAASNTVVDIIVNSPDHNTLEAAVIAAGLVDALSGEGPFTVFAPTDAAFDALPEGTVDALLADPQGELANILLYHVATSIENPQSPFTDGQKIVTLSNGKILNVTANSEGIFINDAQITVGWLLASNGVVHVIDAVLLPTFTVADIISNSTAHTTLTAALNAAGLTSTLQEDGSFTVFAPTDAAFDALPEGTLEALLNDIPTLTDILLYHVSDDEFYSTDIENFGFGYGLSLNDKTVTLRFDDGNIFVNDVLIVIEDIEADNGVVHVINSVLLAPDSTIVDVVRNSPNHTILESLLDLSEFSGPLSGYGPFTLFAPTDAAINALSPEVIAELTNNPSLLEDVLLYHLLGSNTVSGDLSNGLEVSTLLERTVRVTINNEGVFINNAKVTVVDILTDNGVVHVIDAVLLPPYTVSDVISDNENLSELSFLLFVTGLSQALNGSGPFTVFAPNDDAINNISQELIEFVMNNPNGLNDLLTYHVTNGLRLSSLLENGQSIATLNGNTVIVTIADGRVFVNSAEVIETDLLADNGVVHIIDQVLDPRTSVFDVVKEKVQIYPNPTMDMIKIKDLEIGQFTYFITDMNNKIISTGQLGTDNSLDVRDLSNGSYILLLQNKNKVLATTFVKVN